MIALRRQLGRPGYVLLASLLTLATLLPAFVARTAHAFPTGGQVTSRSIQISNSTAGATGVTYTVSFKSTTSFNLKGIIVDFCDGTTSNPIVGDNTCNTTANHRPSGFSLGASPTVAFTAGAPNGTWTAASLNTNQTLRLTNPNATNTQVGGTTVVTFNITGVTNPTAAGTFYARIITYDSDSGDVTSYTQGGTEGSTNAKDYGGIALSATSQITITAKVQESLTFCVYKTSCGTAANIVLGDANGVLNSSNAYANADATFSLATNAVNGVTVRAFGTTLCRSATFSVCSDPTNVSTTNPTGPGNTVTPFGASPLVIATGTEQFGFCVNPGAGITAGTSYNSTLAGGTACSGVTTSTSPYAGTAKFGFDTANVASGSSTVATLAGPTNSVTSNLAFVADVANTTEAGIYTSNLALTATGTY